MTKPASFEELTQPQPHEFDPAKEQRTVIETENAKRVTQLAEGLIGDKPKDVDKGLRFSDPDEGEIAVMRMTQTESAIAYYAPLPDSESDRPGDGKADVLLLSAQEGTKLYVTARQEDGTIASETDPDYRDAAVEYVMGIYEVLQDKGIDQEALPYDDFVTTSKEAYDARFTQNASPHD